MSMSLRTSFTLLLLPFLMWVSTDDLPGQCWASWTPTAGLPGTTGYVFSTTMWDPDGAGPQTPLVVVGGWFGDAASPGVTGSVMSESVAAYDPVSGQWIALNDLVGTCRCLAARPNGELFVAGDLNGGGTTGRIYECNTSIAFIHDSLVFGSGTTSSIDHMVVLPNGLLIVAGNFTVAGGDHFDLMACWNGTNWSAFGGLDPTTGITVTALEVLSNGDLVAAFAGPEFKVAKWTGSGWATIGQPFDGWVTALARMPNGDIAVGGEFLRVNYDAVNNTGTTARRVAKWNGSTWSSIGAPTLMTSGGVLDLAVLANGDLVAAGTFFSGSHALARWTGTAWASMGVQGNNDFAWASTLTVMPSGDLVVGGSFADIGQLSVRNIARWNGSIWSRMGSGFDGSVTSLASLPDGRTAVGGTFASAGDLTTGHVAVWDGAHWTTPGNGVDGFVNAVAFLPNGDLIVAGSFGHAGGTAVTHGGSVGVMNLARWDGSSWSEMGSGLNGEVKALAVLPNGDVVAGGYFNAAGAVTVGSIARWNGSIWSAIGSGVDGEVRALLARGNDLFIGGQFTTAGGVSANSIARLDTTTGVWSPLGAGVDGSSPQVLALAARANGEIFVGGSFTIAGGVSRPYLARWDGAAWHGMGSLDAEVSALQVLPDDQLAVGGGFSTAGGVACRRLARWSASGWSILGVGGVDDASSPRVMALALTGRGLAVGGDFMIAGQDVSPYFAWLDTNCPATASIHGWSCPSSGGANTLSWLTPPWVDATFRARAIGLPPVAIVLALTSVTSFPQGSCLWHSRSHRRLPAATCW